MLVVATLASALSCEDDEPEGPTDEEMHQVAFDVCAKVIACGRHDITQEDCVPHQVGTYKDAPECVAVYYFDECMATQTCKELEWLEQLGIGDCRDERDAASDVLCDPY